MTSMHLSSSEMVKDAQSLGKGLVIIDASVDSYQSLVAGVVQGLEVHILDAAQDGIEQISALLAGYQNLTSLHIVSHAQSGALQLGKSWMNTKTLSQKAESVMGWADALSADAALLIYGCEAAKGEQGQSFIAQLSELIGARIIASTTKTGAAALGGNWTLEVNCDKAALAFEPSVMTSYAAVLAAGDLDTTFGINGKVTTDFNGYFDAAYGIVIQSNGQYVVAGIAGNAIGTNFDFALSRYNSNGSLDLTFGTNGKVTTDFKGSDDFVYSMVQQSDGKFVVAGHIYDDSSDFNDFALSRYNSDGSLDTTFGTGGKVTTDFSGSYDYAYSIIQQQDGKLVVAGQALTSGGTYDFALSRYNINGSLDTSFGINHDGKVTTDFNGSGDYATSVIQQSDGKLVVAGDVGNATGDPTSLDFALSRYNTDGSLDTTFGADGTGKVTTDFKGFEDFGWRVIQQSDGKFVVAGVSYSSSPGTSDFALSRYNSDGTLDKAFGVGGKVTTDFSNNSSDFSYSVVQQKDGKLLVAGDSTLFGSTDTNFAIVRFNTNGSLDQTFGTGGKVTTDFNNSGDSAWTLTVQPDGNIVLVGNNGSDFAIARYLGDNLAPVNTVPGAQSVNEDTQLAISGISVSDSNGNLTSTQLTVSSGKLSLSLASGAIISAGSNNSATLTLSGTQTQINAALATLTYQGSTNFNGPDTLTIVSKDSAGIPLSDTDTVSITVNPVNDAPAQTGSQLSLPHGTEDTPYSLKSADLLMGYSDVDGDTLTITNLSATNGTLTSSGKGSYVFTPTLNYNGAVSFSYSVIDGNGGSVAATQSLVIDAVNDAPVLTGTKATLAAGTAGTLYTVSIAQLLQGFTDVEGDALSVSNLSVSSGTFAQNSSGVYVFTPATNYTGPVTLNYSVTDGNGGTAAATQSFSISSANHAPTGLSLSSTAVVENVAASTVVGTFASADLDAGDRFTYALVSGTGSTDNAAFTISDNQLKINTSPDYEAKSSYSIRVRTTDAGGLSYAKAFTIGVTDVNEAPTATSKTVSTSKNIGLFNSKVTVDLSDSIADPDGNGLANSTLRVTNVKNGIIASVNQDLRQVTFTPAVGFSGAASFQYTVTDAGGLSSSAATVTVEVGDILSTSIFTHNVQGTNGDDYIFGVFGRNTISGGNGNDYIVGGTDQDTIFGGSGNDTLLGSFGNDTIVGGAGDDLIDGGAGNDVLTGDAGRDTFVLARYAGSDTVTDFAKGQDLLGLSGGLSFGQLSLRQSGADTLIQTNGSTLATLTGVSATLITATDFVTV